MGKGGGQEAEPRQGSAVVRIGNKFLCSALNRIAGTWSLQILALSRSQLGDLGKSKFSPSRSALQTQQRSARTLGV